MRKIIITGANSFIGRYFINSFRNYYDISEVDLLTTPYENILFKPYEIVFHVAAIVHQSKKICEEQYFNVNKTLAYKIASQAKIDGVKQFIFMSTVKVYGESNEGFWNEFSECNPTDPYGKSKLEAERLIRGLEDDNFKVAIVRSPLIYGPGVRANMLSLINLVDKYKILPFGDINNKRSLVYIGNLVALINNIIENNASGIFVAGDREPLSTTQIIEYIAEGLNKKVLLIKIPEFIINTLSYLAPNYVNRLFGSLLVDNTYTNKKISFYPPFSSKEGFSEMIKWYIEKKSR